MSFTWMDLVAPWGIGLLAAALCIWAVIVAKNVPAKIVSAITGLCFIALIPIFYWVRADKTEYVYKTEQGVGVVVGKKNKCEKPDVEKEVQWVIDFWSKHYDASKVADSLKGKRLFCIDDAEFTVYGRWVRGVSFGNSAVVGWNGKPEHTVSLIRHELSHLVLGGVGEVWNEDVHHKIFEEKGLGY